MAQAIINIAPMDSQLSVTLNLPASGNAGTTGIIDMEATAPNSNAWRLGRFAIVFPNLPENNVVANTITVAMQAAPPSLTNSLPAPAGSVPGAFAAPAVSQILTVAGVVGTGSLAGVYYMTLAFDPTGSVYQYYQFVITVGAIATLAEPITIGWIPG